MEDKKNQKKFKYKQKREKVSKMTFDEIDELLNNKYTDLDFETQDCCYCLKRNHTIRKCFSYKKQKEQNSKIVNVVEYIQNNHA